MDNAQRRSEILQAEEAVRLLARELGKAESAKSAAQEVHESLKQAVEVVTMAGEGVSEAGRAQMALEKASEEAIRTAGQENRQAICSATESLEACLEEVREVCGQFQTATGDLSAQTERKADVLAERIEQLNASISGLAEVVAGVQSVTETIEVRVSDLNKALARTNDNLAAMKEDTRARPTELAAQIHRSIGKRMGILVYVLVFSMLSLIGTGALIWLLVVVLANL